MRECEGDLVRFSDLTHLEAVETNTHTVRPTDPHSRQKLVCHEPRPVVKLPRRGLIREPKAA